jgi:translation elongation factor EF-G
MDRLGCDIETTVHSVKRRLKVDPIVLNMPSSENQLLGIIDLTSQMHIDYSQDDMGKIVTIEEIDKDHKLYEKMSHNREIMVS